MSVPNVSLFADDTTVSASSSCKQLLVNDLQKKINSTYFLDVDLEAETEH